MRWSDLEYVLAVASNGSAAAAARALNVNHTTVLRRVKSVEDRLNIRIFEHLRSGYQLTPEGEMFLDAAQSIEATVADLDRKMAGGYSEMQGTLSITTTDSIFGLLAPDVGAIRRAHPEVVVDFTIANNPLDLDNRDADIAIRASSNPPHHLIGRRICDLRFAVYAPRRRAEEERSIPLAERQWLGLAPPLTGSIAGQWIKDAVPPDKVVMRSNSFVGLRALAVQDLGHTVLPRFLGDAAAQLVRIDSELDALPTGLWLLTHPDILRSPRVRMGADFLFAALRARRAEFEGM